MEEVEDVGDLVNQLMQEVDTPPPPTPAPTSSSSSSDDFAQFRFFSQWRLAAQRKLLEQSEATTAKLAAELEYAKSQLSRQHKDFSMQMQELSLKRNHGLDVSDLAQQVRDLVKEVERLKLERTSNNPAATPIIQQQGNKMVGTVLRDYHVKLCRLEEEISNEKLKRATETSRRIEKESECNQCRRQMEDMRAEIISLQLKLARMEVGGDIFHAKPPTATKHAKIVVSPTKANQDDIENETTCTQQ